MQSLPWVALAQVLSKNSLILKCWFVVFFYIKIYQFEWFKYVFFCSLLNLKDNLWKWLSIMLGIWQNLMFISAVLILYLEYRCWSMSVQYSCLLTIDWCPVHWNNGATEVIIAHVCSVLVEQFSTDVSLKKSFSLHGTPVMPFCRAVKSAVDFFAMSNIWRNLV